MIRLPTWRWIIAAFLSSSRLTASSLVGLGERPQGVLDGGDGLLLHREDPRGLFADLAAGVVELAEDVLVGDDPEPDLAALAEVRALQVVEVAGLGVERDDRARREVQRGEVPVVTDLLVLDRPGVGPFARGAPPRAGAPTSWVGSEPPEATL